MSLSKTDTSWVYNYIKSRFGCFSNEFENDTILARPEIPTKLYKYYPSSYHAIRNFETTSVWLSSPAKDYNDPFECLPAIGIKDWFLNHAYKYYLKTPEGTQIANKLQEKIKNAKNIKEENYWLNSIREPYSIDVNKRFIEKVKENKLMTACFSERNDSILMWSHYADEHKGFCLEFDFTQWNPALVCLLPVVYSAKRVEYPASYLDKHCDNDCQNCGAYILKQAYVTKHIDWEYEKEWRIIYSGSNTKEVPLINPLPLPKNCITKLYIGARTEGVHKEHLIEIAQRNNISYTEMIPSIDLFALQEKEVFQDGIYQKA